MALFISRLVTSPLALEIIAIPELVSERKVVPPTAIKARFILIPEVFSAILTAFFTELTASLKSITYPCRIPFVSVSPIPIILGFFSPFKNSPTTTLVVEDPKSIPIEIFLIIFLFCFIHSTTMFHSFQMKHSVDN